ncbi:MAG TPA: flagellar hook-basal body protein [Gaiellales bacterium]|jgi:flagellar basal-body rod protein FlgG|nr:flagellar hook-basal body protein [Gaiellales bacterium]
MLNGLYSAAAGLIAQQTRMDALANDISNVNTTGYKQLRLGFRDLIYNVESGMRVGAGAALVDGGREFQPGAFQQSDNPLSVAIAGSGFFQVRMADGRTALTRSGDFRVDASGSIVTGTGERLVPPITVPANTPSDAVSIASDGTVKANGETLGRIHLVTVASPDRLQPVGSSLFVPTAQSGAPHAAAGATMQQGFLEASNVDLASAMVNVIDAQRSFQFDSRVIQTQDQLMQIANEIRR